VRVNVGPVNRSARIVLGALMLGSGLFAVRGKPGALLDLLGGVLLFSGTVGFCHVQEFLGRHATARKV
jgi:hypothetical protein